VLYRHRDCGGEAHAHISCDLCGEELTARDVSPEPGPGLRHTLAATGLESDEGGALA
jgi:hypothetical protein